MARRTRTIREMREMVEAAEARGLITPEGQAKSGRGKPAEAEPSRTSRTQKTPRMRVVWLVCDIGGRTVQQFDYARKAEAEALAARLTEKSRAEHFVRSEKVPMTPQD